MPARGERGQQYGGLVPVHLLQLLHRRLVHRHPVQLPGEHQELRGDHLRPLAHAHHRPRPARLPADRHLHGAVQGRQVHLRLTGRRAHVQHGRLPGADAQGAQLAPLLCAAARAAGRVRHQRQRCGLQPARAAHQPLPREADAAAHRVRRRPAAREQQAAALRPQSAAPEERAAAVPAQEEAGGADPPHARRGGTARGGPDEQPPLQAHPAAEPPRVAAHRQPDGGLLPAGQPVHRPELREALPHAESQRGQGAISI
mmetsp:Transcript_3513/g.8804  ORF Transcript_3513/g.8804 Transcript_3513/m.8804 type:complete len:257 (+) Transcript_3513:319-1089(+)